MAINVDARGLSCPQPVLLTKNAIGRGKFPVEVLVDTVTSRENIRRMVESKGFQVKIVAQGDEFKLVISK